MMIHGKRHIRFLLCALLMTAAACGTLRAQSYVGASLAGHVPLTLDRLDITRMQVGYGGEVGFVCEWQKGHFLLRTGVHYNISCPRLAVDSQLIEQDMIDTRDIPFTYRGTLASRTERITAGQIAVPFYVGAVWKGFYVLAGAKVGVNLHAKATQKAQLKTAGDYIDRYYEWLEGMPNHGFHEFEDVRSDHDMPLNLIDVRVGGEIGYTFRLSSSRDALTAPLLRVGAFAEYSVLDLRDSDTKQSLTPRTQTDWSQYLRVNMTHVYASSDAAGTPVNLLTCGLRLTLLFPISESHLPGHCMCLP